MQTAVNLDFKSFSDLDGPAENFALMATGHVKILDDADYKFCLNSSDGSKVLRCMNAY